MKKFKLFIIAGVILVASGLVGTIVANAQEPDKFKKQDTLICDFWVITCFSNLSTHTVLICATSTETMESAVERAIKLICSAQ